MFYNELIQDIENNSSFNPIKLDVIMRTGQYINNMLVTKASLRFFREKMVELNVLFTARTVPVSMICAKSQTSQIMARAVDDVELIIVPLSLMENG
jgi:CRP/FNR family transcriptional regulator